MYFFEQIPSTEIQVSRNVAIDKFDEISIFIDELTTTFDGA